MSAAGCAFYFAPEVLTRWMLGEGQPEVLQLTVPLLETIALAMPALAITMILTGALRGAGDTRWPLVFTFIGFLCIRIPLTYCLAMNEFSLPGFSGVFQGAGLGVVGAWYAMVVDLTARCLLVSARFWLGKWRDVEL